MNTARPWGPCLVLVGLFAPMANAQVRNDTFRVFTVHAPAEIVRVDTILGQSVWCAGQPPEEGITARLVLAQDSSGSDEGCSPFANAGDVAGQIAVIRRGSCGFEDKAWNAQKAGAAAYLVFNHNANPEDGDSTFVIMGCPDGGPRPTIAGGFLARYIRNAILPVLTNGTEVVATLAPYFEDQNPATEEGTEAGGLSLAVSPNPARGPITLSLRLARALSVRVAVFDALGRRVAGVHSGLLARGEHRFPLETSRLAPGVYTVRAESDEGRVARRMTVR